MTASSVQLSVLISFISPHLVVAHIYSPKLSTDRVSHSYYVVALLYNNKSETCVGSLSCLVWVRIFPDQDYWPLAPR